VSGPTGPIDKQLDRKEVWPQNTWSVGQKIRGSLGIWSFGNDLWSAIGRILTCGTREKKVKKIKVSGEVVKG
jgi:hypothetical protein